MKTDLMLLLQTDGRPIMNMADLAKLLSIGTRSLQNLIYRGALPFPVFKLADSGEWVVHVTDVAKHIDEQREAAIRALQPA